MNSWLRQFNIPFRIEPSGLLIGRGLISNNGQGTLPQINYPLSQQASPEITVHSGDIFVQQSALDKVCSLIQKYSLSTLKNYAGITPQGDVHLVLFSSEATYRNALSQAKVDPEVLDSILAVTSGLTVGDTVWIPLYRLNDDIDLTNDLSHELFHAFSNIEGYGLDLPVWVSEGMAWRIALLSQDMISTEQTDYTMSYYEEGVYEAARSGKLLPLTATDTELLSAGYNVQYQYFLAVNELIHTHGQDTFLNFMRNVKKSNSDQQFSSSFQETFQAFQDRFTASLEKFAY